MVALLGGREEGVVTAFGREQTKQEGESVSETVKQA